MYWYIMSYILTADGPHYINDKHVLRSMQKSTREIEPLIQKTTLPTADLCDIVKQNVQCAGSEIIAKLRKMNLEDKKLKSLVNLSKYQIITTR